MSVSIPVGADAGPVVAAFRQISEALKRTSADAQSFADVDLSHPEVKGLVDDLKRVEQNLRDLERLGRGGTAATVRRINSERFGTNHAPNGALGLLDYIDQTERFFPDEAARRRHIDAVGRAVLNGTSFAPPSPPPPPPPEPPAEPPAPQEPSRPMPGRDTDGGGGGGGGGLGGVAGGVMDFAKLSAPWLLAAAGLHGIGSTVMTSLNQAEQESTSNDSLYRSVRDTSVSFDELRDKVRAAADGLEVNYNQAQQLTQQWERLTNATATQATNGVRLAASVAQGYGMDPGSWTQSLGTASYLGQDPRRFAMLIGDAVRGGQMHGQVDQVLQALLSWTERATRLAPGAGVDDDQRFASMYAAMNASGIPGLKGQDGVSLLTQVDSSIRGGGAAGEASQAFLYRAFQQNGVTDPYAVRMLQQSGIFATPRSALGRGSNRTVYEMLRAELDREYGSADSLRKDDAFANLTGLSMPQSRALLGISPQRFASTSDYLRSHGINLDKVNETALPEIAQLIGPGADLEGERKRLLALSGTDRLSDKERASITGKSGEGLRSALVQLLASHGMTTTEGSDFKTSTDKLYNALTAAGTGLIPAVSDLKNVTGALASAVADLTSTIGNIYNGAIHPGSQGPDGPMPTLPAIPTQFAPIPGSPGHPALPGLPAFVGDFARADAVRLKLRPDVMTNMFRVEHGGYNNVSPKGAFGPAQLMPDTAAQYGVATNIHDPNYNWQANADAGERDFRDLLKLYNGNYPLALAAYNAGPNNPGVKYFAATGDQSRLPDETKKYLRKILGGLPANTPDGKQPLVPGAPGQTGTQTPVPSNWKHAREMSMDMTHRFAPLQINIQGPGTQSQQQFVPVTHVGRPMPIGLA